MLRIVTKNIYLLQQQKKQKEMTLDTLSFYNLRGLDNVVNPNCRHFVQVATHSANDISPSPFVSNSIKKSEGAQRNSPGTNSPFRNPSLTRLDSDGEKTGTTALIKSAGVISTSPLGVRIDAKYSKT